MNLEDVVMHGAGNRFLLHFGSKKPLHLLHSYEGLDGVLSISECNDADLEVSILNADGSMAEQCGNGLRCVALHAIRSNYINGNELTIKTLAGMSRCIVKESKNEVTVDLSVPVLGMSSCHATPNQLLPNMTYVSFGNPNAVLWIEDNPIDIRMALGEQLATHSAFKQGMNIHFARRDTMAHATCATWERGVGPTLASGTGGAAVFVAANVEGLFQVSSFGGTLSYEFNDIGSVLMTGPAGYA